MAISAIIGLVSAFTTTLAGGTFAGGFLIGATTGTFFTHFLVTTAIGAALNALAPKPNRGSGIGGYSANARGSNLDRQIIYGETRVGGAIVFNATNSKEDLHRLIVFADHEVDSYSEIYIGEDKITSLGTNGEVLEVVDPDGNTSERYKGNVEIVKRFGKPNQQAIPEMLDAFASGSGDTDIVWTDQHRLRGLAYLYVHFKYNREVFPNGIPDVRATVKGKKVYDPRTDDTVWSDNPALCIADYITSEYGLNEAPERVDWAAVATAANVCDSNSRVTGKARYTMNGAVLTSTTPSEFFSEALKSMGGLMWYMSGKWRMKAASWTAPVAHFTMDNLRSSIDLNTRQSRRDNFNAVSGTYYGPETLYQVTDYPQVKIHEGTGAAFSVGTCVAGEYYEIDLLGDTDWNDLGGTVGLNYIVGDIIRCAKDNGLGTGQVKATIEPFLQADNGQRSVVDNTLMFTNNYYGCKQLSRIFLERNRQQLTISAAFDLSAMEVTVGDNITLTMERFGWTNKSFEVLTWNLQPRETDEGFLMEIRMTLREISEGVFDEKDTGSAYERDNTSLPSPFDVDTPTNLNYETEADIDTDGKTVSDVTFSWDHPFPGSIAEYEVQWKRLGRVEWKHNATTRSTTFTLDNVNSRKQWEWRVRAINGLGIPSPWVAGPTATVSADTTIPKQPTNVSGLSGYRSVVVTWTAPTQNTDDTDCIDLKRYHVYRGGTFLAATDTTRFTDNGLTPATNYNYTVTAVDNSGNESAQSTSASVLVLADPADGVDGISVLIVYADDAVGTNQSLTAGSREYVTYYEYNTSGGAPSLPLPGGTDFVKFIGVGQSIWPIYATDASGNNQSFTQGTRRYINFYEREGGAPTLPRTTDEDGDPLVWVKFEGEDGADGSNAQMLVITTDTPVVTYDDEGAISPSAQTVTFTANRQNVSGTVSWATSPSVKSGSGDTFTLDGSTHFGSEYSSANRTIEVTATLGGLTDKTTITILKEGSGAIYAFQSNEAHVIPCDSSGTPLTFVDSDTYISAYQGIRELLPVASDNTPAKGSFTITGVTYSNCSGPTGEVVSGNQLYLGPITAITSNTASRAISVRVGTYPNGDYRNMTIVQTFSKARNGSSGPTGDRGAGRWDIQLPVGVNLPSGSVSARNRWNDYGRSNGNSAPARPVVADQAWFRDNTGAQAVFICDSVSSNTSHTWVEQDEVIDGNLLVSGTVNMMDAAVGNEIASSNWYSSSGEDGWIIRQDGSATFNGPILSRSLQIAEGSFTLPGTISGTALLTFANTGVRIGKDDVWRVNDRTFIVSAVITSGVTASAGFDPKNTYWGIETNIFPGARWSGGTSWNDSTLAYRNDPPTTVDLPGRTGVDQRILFNGSITTLSCYLVNPTIEWKLFQVT